AQQTGVELHQLLRSAVRHADRVLLYAESTIFPWDLDAIPYALGSVARKQGEPGRWIIEAPSPVVLEVGEDVDEVLLDGRLWPAFYRGAAIIPRGRHEVTVREGISRYWGRPQGLRILKVTADLLWARTAGQDIEFEYETFAPALVVVNARPDQIVDLGFLASVVVIWSMTAYQLVLTVAGYFYAVQSSQDREVLSPAGLDWPTVSVLVPAHNEERVIRATVQALLEQDYPSDRLEI